MRKITVAGNWKMNKSPEEAAELAMRLRTGLGRITQIDVVLCPPFPSLGAVYEKIRGSHIKLGAQDVFWEKEGAFTGEVSTSMLRESGCHYVIVGHSERRIHFGEKDRDVNLKTKAALQWNLVPVVCVGEKLEERKANKVEQVLDRQLQGSLKDIGEKDILRLIIAYEPVWAIGTGETATPNQANDAQGYIRKVIARNYCEEVSLNTRVIYGGSVRPGNMGALIKEENIDGALVGGASLEYDSFSQIVTACLPNLH